MKFEGYFSKKAFTYRDFQIKTLPYSPTRFEAIHNTFFHLAAPQQTQNRALKATTQSSALIDRINVFEFVKKQTNQNLPKKIAPEGLECSKSLSHPNWSNAQIKTRPPPGHSPISCHRIQPHHYFFGTDKTAIPPQAPPPPSFLNTHQHNLHHSHLIDEINGSMELPSPLIGKNFHQPRNSGNGLLGIHQFWVKAGDDRGAL